MTLSELIDRLGGTLVQGDPQWMVDGGALPERANPFDAVFADGAAGAVHALSSKAGVVVITPKVAASGAAIILPEDAIQNLDGRDVVFARTADGFRVQPVRVAARSGGRASVVSGLKPGDQVATRNAFLLKAEMGKGQDDDE